MQRILEQRIWMATVAIMIFGLAALYSASYQNARVERGIFFDQLIWALLGLLVMFLLSRFDCRRLFSVAYIFYILNVVLLITVLIIGRNILGARRWIEVGNINFQPSELMKLAVIIVLARYLSRRNNSSVSNIQSLLRSLGHEFIVPLFLVAFPMLFIFKQPDLGTALLLLGVFIILVFASGVKSRFILSFLSLGLVVEPFAWHILKPYQKERLMVFLNPSVDPLGAGYTIIQSKIAVGSGRLFGKGWFGGTQNQLNFLPERHTDFIFSVIGEEWGFLGAAFLIFCFFILIDSGLKIAQHSHDRFGFLMAVGISGIFALQTIVNIGMVLGLFPVVGLTLPFVSYGRSSFMVSAIMLGILLSLNRRRIIF